MNRRPEIRERRKREKRRQRRTFVLVVLAAAALVTAAMIYPSIAPIGDFASITPIARPQTDGRQIGDASAPVLIEMYEDFQCPGCKAFTDSIEPRILDAYVATGQARLTYRHYPFLGEESLQAAHASMCADAQGRFWDYHDMLFANQVGENRGAFADRRLLAFAESLGLEMEAFQTCFDEQAHEAEIAQDLEAASQAGVHSTPTILVNGVIVPSATPGAVTGFPEISAAIEAALADPG
jgi:protein-disulfide isomerase